MKKTIACAILLIASFASSQAQTIVFHENFESPSGADSLLSGGDAPVYFDINTRIAAEGLQCDSNFVQVGDTSFLRTIQFDCSGYSNVMLQFSHICKISLLDAAEIYISISGGAWTKLTNEYINPGNSQFVNMGYKFNVNSYPVDWVVSNAFAKPENTWWKDEVFDISALAGNQSDVRLLFLLRDGDAVNNAGFHGWYIDDIKVVAAFSELIPPQIIYSPPYFQDTIYNSGPYNIYTWITDVSGIDTAWLTYTVNGGSNQYLPAVWISDSTYLTTIPSCLWNTSVSYYMTAQDSSPAQNFSTGAVMNFFVMQGPSTVIIGTGTTTTYYSPFYSSGTSSTYRYSNHIDLFTAAEINTGGEISMISWNKSNTLGYTYNDATVRIYLKETTASTVSTVAGTFATELAGATLVYENTMQSILANAGWMDFDFNITNFNYTGLQNLMVLVDFYHPQASEYLYWYYTLASGKAYTWSSTTTPPTSGYGSGYRPNTKFGFQPTNNDYDAAITFVTGPSGLVTANTPLPINVILKNFAIDTLNNVAINWALDGIYQGTYNWVGALIPGASTAPITIDNHSFTLGAHSIDAWTSNPNGMPDQFVFNDTASSNLYACDSILNGTYTIGPAGDFTTFNAAIASMLNCGIGGPVVFNVASGTYTEQLTIPEISGTSAINTITFQSASGINTDVILQYAASGTADNFVLLLSGADHMIFKNISIRSTAAATYGRVVELRGGANENSFEGNILQSIVTTSSSSAVIYSYSTASDNNNIFSNNQILNGYYGIYFYGSSTYHKINNQFIENEITGWYYYGMYLYYHDSIQIIGNHFQNAANSGTNYHIYSYYNYYGCRILQNKINGNGTGSFYGIGLVSPSNTTLYPNLIANNFISQSTGTTTCYGIYLSSNNNTNVYFNSVNITGSYTSARALYQTGGTSGINIENNIFSNTGGGYAAYIGTPAAINVSDHNDLFATGINLGYWSINCTSLSQWQTSSSQDNNSISVSPGFLSLTDLHATTSDLCGGGIPISGISDDIDGDLRNAISPCIGADEFQPLSLDAGILQIDEPSLPVGAGPVEIRVSLKNFGSDTLSNVTINYDINGTPGTPYPWTGNLPSFGVINNILIATTTFSSGTSTLRVWTSQPNGATDLNQNNDTASTNVQSCGSGPLVGNYSIGGATPDYNSFTDAIQSLQDCGLGGPVVFNVATGTYIEQISIPEIPGVSAVNTITFQSVSGVNTDVDLQYAAIGTSDNFVVQLDGADYIIFKNMSIHATTASTYGRVLEFRSGACNNRFENNNIVSVPVTSSNAAAIYSGSGSADNQNVFVGNQILNGYYGVYFYASSSVKKTSNQFIENEISGWYYYGIYLYYNDTVVIEGNRVANGSSTTTAYPVYLYYCNNNIRVEKNIIEGNCTTFYGIRIYYCTAASSDPIRVANNFISHSTGAGTAYGLYVGYSNYVNLYYNSVNITGGSSTGGRSIYLIGGTYVNILNNIFMNSNGGYAFYIGTITAVQQSDYNDIYTTGTTLGYWGSAVANLTALQTLSSKDVHSISADPVYISTTDLHVLNPALNAAGIAISGIPDDIDNELRSPTSPDIGADEFTPLPIDISVTAFASPVNAYASAGTSVSVSATVRNMGSNNVSAFTIFYTYGGMSPVSSSWSGTLAPNQTVNVTFPTPFSVIGSMQSLCAYTVMASDGDHSNDTLCMGFTGVSVLSVPDSMNFETTNYFYPDNSLGLWEFGTPISSTINSAHSPTHSWKTNLDGYYTANSTEYLYTPYYSFTQVNDATLKFWHWYQTELNYDGGKIEYSLNGSTWITLGYIGDPAATNWYVSTISGSQYWSGSSSGWVLSTYDLSTIPTIVNATNPVQFRYKFISNASNSNYDGWAIDDFAISAPPIPKDAGVSAITSPSGSTVTGDPVTLQITLMNYGTDSLHTIPVGYRVNGGPVSTSVWTGVLMPGASTSYTCPATYTSPASTYTLCAFTSRSGDTYKSNDTSCIILGASAAALDAGIISILSPGTTTVLGDSIEVSVRIKNFGTSALSSMSLGYSRNGIQQATATWTGSLVSGDSVDYTFSQKYISPLSTYSLCAYSMLSGDANATNDQHCIYPEGVSGIEEYQTDGYFLWQNIPNPAHGNTSIDFYIPVKTSLRFEIRNLLGQLIYIEEGEYSQGRHTLELNTDAYGKGTYFYSIAVDGHRLTKKMLVY